jgi:hypothetical protein
VKGYIDSLENRLYQLETTLLQLLPFVSNEQLNEITASIPPLPNRHYFRARFNATNDGKLPYDPASSPARSESLHDQHKPISPQIAGDNERCCSCVHREQRQQTRSQDHSLFSFSWPQFAVPNRAQPLTTYGSIGSSELDFMPELDKAITQQGQQDLVQEILLNRYEFTGNMPALVPPLPSKQG